MTRIKKILKKILMVLLAPFRFLVLPWKHMETSIVLLEQVKMLTLQGEELRKIYYESKLGIRQLEHEAIGLLVSTQIAFEEIQKLAKAGPKSFEMVDIYDCAKHNLEVVNEYLNRTGWGQL